VIHRILIHLELWPERKENERGTALLEETAPDAKLVCEGVDDEKNRVMLFMFDSIIYKVQLSNVTARWGVS